MKRKIPGRGHGTNDNNQGYLKHLYIVQQAVQAITSDPNVQNGASKWVYKLKENYGS